MLHHLFQRPVLASAPHGGLLLNLFMALITSTHIRANAEPSVLQGVAGHKGQYWFPPETAVHEATILGFPSQNSLPRGQVNLFRTEVIEIAEAISQFEAVRLYARLEEVDAAQAMMDARSPNNTNVTIIPFPIVHPWVRDTAPTYVFQRNGTDVRATSAHRFAVDFNFNEWGGKVPVPGSPWGDGTPALSKEELEDNAKFAERIITSDNNPGSVNRVPTRLTLEGGGVEVDGEGTLLITESALLNDNRNPGMSRKEIYDRLQRLLGVTKIISVQGLRGLDITDCHIDGVVRFARPGVVVISRPHINQGKNWVGVADETIQVLGNDTDAKGRPFELHVLNEPDPFSLVGGEDGEMSLSYANFYQVNGGVIIPAFGNEKTDSTALELFERLYPDRKVVQIGTRAIASTGGGIHCVTQQIPMARNS